MTHFSTGELKWGDWVSLILFPALLAIALVGCSLASNSAGAAGGEVSTPVKSVPSAVGAKETETRSTCSVAHSESCREELEAVASCFHAVVTAKQGEPGDKSLAGFLCGDATAREKADSPAACKSIDLTRPCQKLVLSTGAVVKFEKQPASHDNLGAGAVFHVPYRFFSADCPDDAKIEIQLHVGDTSL